MQAIIPLAAALLLAAVVAISRWPWLGLIIVAYLALTIPRGPTEPALVLGQFNIFAEDIAALLLGIAGLIRCRQVVKNLRGQDWTLHVLLLLAALSLGRGMVSNSLAAAIVESRPLLWLGAAIFFALSVSWDALPMRRILFTFSSLLGIALVALAAYNAARYGIGGSSSGIYVDGLFETSRILMAPQALLLGLCALFLFASPPVRLNKSKLLLTALFALVVIASQQRTTWIAMAIGGGILLLGKAAGRWGKAALLVVAGLWLGLLILLSGLFDSAIASLLDSASDSATINARMASWGRLLSQNYDSGLGNFLFGAPFGSGFSRTEPNGLILSTSPHSFYIFVMLRMGLVGLLALLVFAGTSLWRLRGMASLGRFALLVAVLVFALSYSPSWMLLPYLGWVLVKEGPSENGLRPPAELLDQGFRRREKAFPPI